jgi:lipopolysaccharide biosynthesis glycosyltransferase
MRVFIGVDSRQSIAGAVLSHSISVRSTEPVSITLLHLHQLPITHRGLTEFTYSRYLVPWLCNYEGKALFIDADMLCLGDIANLFKLYDESAVQVVKSHRRFEWPSLMLFNCEKCKMLTPDYVQNYETPQDLKWASEIGELPAVWNHLVGYDSPKAAQIVHFTKGIPVWEETRDCEYADLWHEERKAMMSTCGYRELMGKSIHIKESA